jgi:hypothetical protein
MRSSQTKDQPAPKPVSSSRRARVNVPEENGQRSAEFRLGEGEGESARRGADEVDSHAFEDRALDGLERGWLRAAPERGEIAG